MGPMSDESVRRLGMGTENGKSHSSRLARYDRKMPFHLTTVGQTGQFDKMDSTPRLSTKLREVMLI